MREKENKREEEKDRETHTYRQTSRKRKTKEKESSPKNFKKKFSNFLNGGGCESSDSLFKLVFVIASC
jgi:hypothetical protein